MTRVETMNARSRRVRSTSSRLAVSLIPSTVEVLACSRVVLAVDGDEQRVLDAARAAGRVTLFSAVQPTLTDLFRQAVQA